MGCSGQSNMEWTVPNTKNTEEEIRQRQTYSTDKAFLVQKAVSMKPKKT
jgi:hypothetical protein